ncbi:MAG: rhodanese-like domain-containing protein [Meiothermus sp.]|uniref:rhodanese-like domain-containing protein n=1 Tax=Meiothermus sp. TaxID=1955249 RepID=UPI0025E9E1D3|nr:rhodanese-like domain-containing protein [Meiothermus sp.]MCS7058118.1 rhodanese-like domain-containing protein [Meiothermus sp.]MCS7194359.1 rhodanese-like domain-containing protein [Meiothermus sp.]MCX7740269.1 rhodanese-like domain-containing protein [Meiothermus sp.]MDW8089840.1 rhodanese-like domain-containing protein [Meiothermus sp.]MDW8481733.1 rhodanese-like domain-containing protein [Meiothermus sp.]
MLTVPYKDISPTEARKLQEQNTLFVDVREPEEFAQARIEGARLIPLSEFAARHQEIPKDEPVVLYCRSGARSAQAAAWLSAKGYPNILNLDGGILAWYQAGLPLDTEPQEAVRSSTAFTELTPQEAQAWIQEGAYVVDVREPYEYAMGHVPGAVNIPLGRLAAEVGRLPKDRKLLLVCASGNRSSQAAEYLVGQGFEGSLVGNLEGGTYGWMAAGLEVER